VGAALGITFRILSAEKGGARSWRRSGSGGYGFPLVVVHLTSWFDRWVPWPTDSGNSIVLRTHCRAVKPG
jgi:hypothetical protein